MGLKEILEFVKIEHTLFSLPFVFIGAELAGDPSLAQLAWILVAAIGARGLAMALNRIIDRNRCREPEDIGRHLASGTMRLSSVVTVWIVSTDAFARCLAIE